MEFKNFDNQNEDEKLEESTKFSPEMQKLYDEIVAGNVDENILKEKAEKMSVAERFTVLGEAIKRAGKLARKIALVAFVGFSPSLAGSADSAKTVEENLKNETQKEWQKVKNREIEESEITGIYFYSGANENVENTELEESRGEWTKEIIKEIEANIGKTKIIIKDPMDKDSYWVQKSSGDFLKVYFSKYKGLEIVDHKLVTPENVDSFNGIPGEIKKFIKKSK